MSSFFKCCYVFLILLSFEHAYSQCGGTSVGTFTLLKNGVPTTSPIELCPGDCWQLIPNGDAVLPPPFPGQPSQVLLSMYDGVPNLSGVPNTTLLNPFSDPNFLNSFTQATITSCNYANDIPSWGLGNNLWFVPYTLDDGKVVWSDPADQIIIDNNNDGCFAWGTPIEILYHPIPNAGTSGNVTLCTTNSPVNLFSYLGGTPQNTGVWAGPSALSGGSLGTFDPATMTPGTYLYGVGGDPSCSTVFAAVTVVTNSPPNAGSNGTVTYCSAADGGNLISELGGTPLTNGTWSGPSGLGSGSSGFYNSASATPGVYTYSVTGLAPCATSTVTANVTVSEVLTPNSGIGGTLTACSNTPPVSLFSFLSGSPDANGTWSGPSVLTGGNVGTFDPATMTAGVYTYSVVGTSPCVNTATTNVTVVINAAPDAGLANTITLCSNGASSNLFASLGGTPSNTGTWSGPSALTGGNLGTYDPSTMSPGDYTYTVSGLAPCAYATAIITVVEELAPDAGINGNIDFCLLSSSGNLFTSLGGTPSNIGTWSGPSILTGGNLGTFDPATMNAGVYTYTVNGISLCSSISSEVTVVVNSLPDAGSDNAITLCSNGSVVNLFTSLGGSPQNTGTWSGPSVLAGGNLGSYDPATMTPGNYIYTVAGVAPCTNSTATITVVEEVAADAGINGLKDFCSNGLPENLFSFLGGTPQNTGVWSGTSALTGGDLGTFDPSTMTAGTYTYTVTGVSPCLNSVATITVGISTAPEAGTNNTVTVCSNGTSVDLFASLGGTPSNTGAWSGASVLSGGHLGTYDPVTMSPGNYVYTVSGVAPCADAIATITVVEETAPDAGVSASHDFCSNGVVEDLFSFLGGTPNATGAWTGPSVLSGGNLGGFNPATLSSGVYTYTVNGVAPCVVTAASVTVTINTVPDAGTNNNITVCSNETSFDLFSLLGGTPQSTGTWSGPSVLLGGNVGTYDPSTMSPGNYVYTVSGIAPCVDVATTITVIEQLTPNAGVDATTSICISSPPVNLFSLLGSSVDATGIWSGPSVLNNGNLGTYDPATMTPGVYDYTVTGTSPCVDSIASITVLSTSAPVPVVATLPNLTDECSISLAIPTALDNCGGTVFGTTTTASLITTQGTTIVTWSYDDGNGNISTQNQTVIIDDVTAPVPDLLSLADVTRECDLAWFPVPWATDNCGFGMNGTTTTTLPITTVGTNVVEWTFDDGNGNVTTANQNIIITDTDPPFPPGPLPDVWHWCQVDSVVPRPYTWDLCSGDIFGTTSTVFPITTPGTTVVTWEFDDGNGNVITQTQNIVIENPTPPWPIFNSYAPWVWDECSYTPDSIPLALSDCGDTLVGVTNTIFPITTQGFSEITWYFTTAFGIVDSLTQNVEVFDYTMPVPDSMAFSNFLGSVQEECSYTPISPPTATDNCAGTIIGTTTQTFPITTPGVTSFQWFYDDGNGHVVWQWQDVFITDITAPVVDSSSFDPVVYVECPYTPLSPPTAIDNCIGTIVGTSFNAYPLQQGVHWVYWEFVDDDFNYSWVDQQVIVNDVTFPVLDATSLPDVYDVCEITSLPVPTASDNCLGTIQGDPWPPFPITTPGLTTIYWTFTDDGYNTVSQTQNVYLTDPIAPIPDLAVLPDVVDGCAVVSLTPPTATDNCAGALVGTTNTVFPITAQGTTVVTWVYDDLRGNIVTQDQNVTINDVTLPVADLVSLPDLLNVCAIASLTPPTATDNCSGLITGTTGTVLPITAQGTTVVTWSFEDASGNISTQDQNVIINDGTLPLADAVALPDLTDECAISSFVPPTATDNCIGTITGTTITVLPITAQGATLITWNFDDGNGNISTQTQNVIINDITAPLADIGLLPNVTDQCEITSLPPPTATDNCNGIITGATAVVLPITTQGTTIVTWTYDDGNGNISTQDQNVIITDITAPLADVASLPAIIEECAVTSLTPPTAVDNCSGVITGTTSTVLPITSQGTTVVTWTYNDSNGNISTQDQNVIINDVTAPVATLAALTDVTDQCAVTSLTTPTAMDNCNGVIAGVSNAVLPITLSGTTVVTWTYDDGNGNISTQAQNVIINDMSAPLADVASLPTITDECTITSLVPPTATDNCIGLVTATTVTAMPISAQGTTVVTWTFTDASGNVSTQDQNIIINDVTAPVSNSLTLANITNECSISILTPPTATDNCIGAITGTTTTILPITSQGTTAITWSFDDGNGNVSTQTQNVIIDDFTAPIADIGSLPDVTDECEITSLTPPTATDNCNGSITGVTVTTLPITAQGTVVVTWTYDDGNGNISTQNQNVIITDVTAPLADVASLPAITDECAITSLTPPTALDNCNGAIIGTTNTTVPITNQGTTVVTWTYDDGNGNTSTQVQNVIIDDVTAPVATLAALPDMTDQCAVISLTTPTATDNCNGVIAGVSNTVLPITLSGNTVVTWTYDDGNGNISTQTQNVIIDDISAPVATVTSLPDLTDECTITSLTPPTATDNCIGLVTGVTTTVLPITAQGTTVVTWTFIDASGNISTQDQNVTITDVTAPMADILSLVAITDECAVTSLVPPTATDNCVGAVTGTTATGLPITTQGTTVVTWTYDDGNGIISTQTQDVIIDDVSAPLADVFSLVDITDECSITSLTPPTATDNCNGAITGTTVNTTPITAQGTTVVTWTYDDGNGNISTQTQNVIIDDVTAPATDLASLVAITDECAITSLTPPTATDNCNGAVTGSHTTILPITAQGTTVVTWTYDDGNGNLSTQTQDVIIIDVTAPVADLATLAVVTDECAVATLVPPTATDNCNGAITGTTVTTLPIATQGTTVVTWTYDDGNGNISTQDQDVIIQDVSAPIPVIANLPAITGQCVVSTLVPPTASDNCNGVITATTTTALPITAQDTTVVTWTYDDGNGNVSTQDQNIIMSPSYALMANDTACLNTLYTYPDGATDMIISDTVHMSNLTTVAGCDSIITTNIVMIQLLNSGIDGSINFCTTDTITDLFTQLGGVPDTSGVWSPSVQSGSGLFDPASDVAGIYGYTTTNTCGATTSFVTVTISTNPNPGLDSMAFFCEYDQPADLFVYLGDDADAGGTWSPSLVSGAGVFDPGIDTAPVYTYSFSTICGIFSAEVAVVVIPTPTVNTIPDVQIMLGEEIELVTTTNASNYSWSPAEWMDCPTCLSPIATPEEGIEYTITVEENGCSASATVDVSVEYDLVVWVPNVFSPNGDNNNDVLFVRGKGITKLEFKVYDRWGEKVFESRDMEIGWDGSFRGMPMNPSVFVYFLVVEFEDGSSVVKKGDVTLLR